MKPQTLVRLVKDYRAARQALEARVKDRLPVGRRCVYLPALRLTRVLHVVADNPDELVVASMLPDRPDVRWHTVPVEHLYPVADDWFPGAVEVPPGVDIPLFDVPPERKDGVPC